MKRDLSRPVPIVWVPNKGPHDYSPAKKFGEIRYLTKGYVNRHETGGLARELAEGLSEAQPYDFLMVTSLPILCTLAGSILVQRFGRLNLLTYAHGDYSVKEIDFDAFLARDEDWTLTGDNV